VGEPRKFDFTPLPHWDLGPALGIIDFERGTKLTGSRFYVLQGAGARLQRALIAWMLDLHIRQGYQEEYLPFMVKTAAVYGAGQLPKFADNLYKDHEEDLYFVPTAEIPLTGLHMDEILDEAALPKLYTAYTPCFRREKMSAGRDVRGIKRGHQFDKVEMYIYCKPEESEAMHLKMLKDAEETCELLGVPYRVKQLCTGDLGFGSTLTYDLELWAPGCDEWLEVSSVSNVTDFQARRSNVSNIARRWRQGKIPAHVERLGAGSAAHADRRDGKLPASRWLDHRPRDPAPVDGRHRGHQAVAGCNGSGLYAYNGSIRPRTVACRSSTVKQRRRDNK
jgi:seryl-tRNA synthetase